MRGPLFSGAVGHRLTLECLAALVGEREPVVVLSTVWLAEALCERFSVHLIVEPRRLRAGQRARRRAARAGRELTVSVAAEFLPLRPGSVGALILDELAELQDDELLDYVFGLAPHLRPGGLLLALDRTKEPHVESRIAGSFLAATLQGLGQQRPREGALVTLGSAPAPPIVATLRALLDTPPDGPAHAAAGAQAQS